MLSTTNPNSPCRRMEHILCRQERDLLTVSGYTCCRVYDFQHLVSLTSRALESNGSGSFGCAACHSEFRTCLVPPTESSLNARRMPHGYSSAKSAFLLQDSPSMLVVAQDQG